jgi:ribokinase
MSRILNIGSINIDYVYQVPHFVRPGETISAASLELFPGGKGLNQSVALARAGGDVSHAGRTGADGRGMIEALEANGVRADMVDLGGSATGHAIIQVAPEGENCIILFAGANRELERPYIDRVLSGFGRGDFLVLQNEINETPYIMTAASERGMSIVFNPSPIDAEIKKYPLELVRYFVLNEIEGRELSGREVPEEILDEMSRLYPAASIVLTLGRGGVLLRDGGETFSHGIYDVPVVDTTAAGDTFTGFFITALVGGQDNAEALRRASVASSIAVSRAGASSSIPTLDEVLAKGARLGVV